jgi:hypothetical protein
LAIVAALASYWQRVLRNGPKNAECKFLGDNLLIFLKTAK